MRLNSLTIAFFAFWSFTSNLALAHCDTMDGPVVEDAKKSLAHKDMNHVLKWIDQEDEKTLKKIFQQTLKVREQGQEAKELADQYFYEMVIRIHRSSEGECYTGIKPSGHTDPVITATDKALESGNIKPLTDEVVEGIKEGILHRFEKAHKLKKSSEKSPSSGREYVKAYVELTHFMEAIHQLVKKGATHKHQD